MVTRTSPASFAVTALLLIALAPAARAEAPAPAKPAGTAPQGEQVTPEVKPSPTTGCPIPAKERRLTPAKPPTPGVVGQVPGRPGLQLLDTTAPVCRAVPKPAAPPACFKRQALCSRDLEVAKIAWKYFENNYQKQTGLVNSVDGYPSTTIWDAASSLAATVAAYELGLIDEKEFDDRATGLLGALNSQKLFEGHAPNKAYNASTNEMSNYNNEPSEGIGFSALDIARMTSIADLTACHHPKFQDTVQALLQRWNYCHLVKEGQMYGAYVDRATKETVPAQEGRFGYEQYAGKAFANIGFDQHVASRYDNTWWQTVEIYGVPIRFDKRDPKKLGAYNYVVTESYALDAIEFGVDKTNQELLANIFEVQKRRWEKTGVITAVSEDNVDRDPWFIYNTIYVDGKTWTAITDKGRVTNNLRSVSVKAAFSLATLFPEDPYSQVLMEKVANAYDAKRGWYSGVYENGSGYNRAITANTNGIILETLLYKLYGPLHPTCTRCKRALRWNPEVLASEEGAEHCLPGTKPLPKPEPTPAAKPAATPQALTPAPEATRPGASR